MKRLAFVLVAACSGGTPHHAASTEEAPRTAKIAKGEVVDRVLITGSLESKSAEEMRVPMTEAWELPIRWMAEDGTTVKKGDRVLEFDNSQFTSQLEQKKLSLLDAAIAFNTFEGVTALDIRAKDFALQTAQISLAKAKVLATVPEDLLPARTYQERQLELKRAERAVEKAEKELASAKATSSLDRQVKQIELDKAKTDIDNAEKAINALVAIAPREGIAVIGEHPWEGRKYQVGDTVQPGWTIVSLPDFSAGMEVHAQLSDVDDGRVSVGMKGTCTLDAYPGDPLACDVKDLMPVATGEGRSLKRSFQLVLSLDKVDRDRMRPGMSVKVELHRQPLTGPVVPRAAVRFDEQGKPHVRMSSGQTKDLDLDACDAQNCAVKSGLGEGETVLIGGAR